MFKLRNKMLMSICIVFCLFLCSPVFAYSGGSGEPNDPYQISTVSDWQQLMDANTDWHKNFILVNDLDLAGVSLTPVGNYYFGDPLPDGITFTGVFDGNGHIIRNVDINMPDTDYVGLFGSAEGKIRNLGVENVNIRGYYGVGGLAGCNRGTVSSCYATGTVTGYMKVGGLIGWNSWMSDTTRTGVITDCYAICNTSGVTKWVGGLVGDNRAIILGSHAEGTVSGAETVGGLVGWNNLYGSATIIGCYATGTVTGGDYIGGLVGENVGVQWEPYPGPAIIADCYATGATSGENYVGGLVGGNGFGWNDRIENCYSTGKVSGGGEYVGGLVGETYDCRIISSFWDIETSGQTDSYGGEGKTTAEMQDIDTFLNAGWDFVGETANGTDDIWQMRSDIMDYPKLSLPFLNPYAYSGGFGTKVDPYRISTVSDWNDLMSNRNDWSKCFILVNDLDLAGVLLMPIGVYSYSASEVIPFNGVFDGNGHVISNPTIDPTYYYDEYHVDHVGLGLFEYTGINCQIINLGIEDVNVAGRNFFGVGGLVGVNSGTITGCYVTGEVRGEEQVGGLVGWNWEGSSITNCYATGEVRGRNYSGGLVGCNGHIGYIGNSSSSISDCYSTGTVSGSSGVGGLVGWSHKSTISSCYSTGAVSGSSRVGGLVGDNYGSISNCYSTGSVSGSQDVGGLVGYNYSDSISNCYATGTVSGSYKVGGLVGKNSGTTTNCYATGKVSGYEYSGGLAGTNYGNISNCYSTGAVSGSSNYTGGLVGCNYEGSITACYAIGTVTGSGCVGGLVGKNYSGISNCYATGAVTGWAYVGGLVGLNNSGTITNCYATGAVSVYGYGYGYGYDDVTGGLVGRNYNSYGVITASFWDVNTSGLTISAGGEGKTTTQMQDINTFLSAGWDFFGETTNGTEDIWTICDGITYPKFVYQNAKPIADAGPNQTVYAWLDGIAEVELDGSASSDIDECNGLSYHWTWTIDANTYEANGVEPIIELPVGVHTIELIVNDGLADSEPNYVDVNVIAPLKTSLSIMPTVVNRASNIRNIIAVMDMPKGIKRGDISKEPFVLFPADGEEGIEAVRQYVLPCWRNRIRVVALFDKDDLIDLIPDNGKVELQVIGELNSGQYVFGEDSIRLIGKRRPFWPWCRHK